MFTQKELQEYIDSIQNLIDSLGVLELQKELQTKQELLTDSSVWSDAVKSSQLNKEVVKLTKSIEQVDSIKSELDNLQIAFELGDESEFIKIKNQLDQEIENIQNNKFLNGKFDDRGVVLSLYAGAGGIDAQDWSSMLLAMYQSFVKNQGWKTNLISISIGEEAGIKSASLEIIGENAFGLLKEEAGVHRLVRISPFNSGSTRETSFAMVEVLPMGLDNEINIELDEKDLRIDTFMASGKGGQGVNTTYSAVRVVHIPTNLSVSCQDQRNQIQNKDRAIQILKNKLAVLELKKQKEFERELKGDVLSAEWGSQIRNYVLHPYKMVKDTRSGWSTQDVLDVIEKGNLLPVIWSVKKATH